MAYTFHDRKPVYLLSSFHPPSKKSTIDRRDSFGTVKSISVPAAVKGYNSYRGGVDNVDQRLSYYSVAGKSRQWWPRLAWWLINAAIANAHRLFQLRVDPTCSVLQFRMKLMHELAGDIDSPPPIRKHVAHPADPLPSPRHLLIHSDTRHDCSICSHRSTGRHETHYLCSPCQAYVCVTPCYDPLREASHQ